MTRGPRTFSAPSKVLVCPSCSLCEFQSLSCLFFFNTCMPCTDRDGCRAAETEAGGNEYFLDVNSWPQRKKSETEENTVSFRWVLSICQFAKYRTFPSCGVFLSVPCLTQPPGLVELWFCVVEKPGSWRALKPPPPAYFLFTVSKFLSVDSHRRIYFLCPCFCGGQPVCGGPF